MRDIDERIKETKNKLNRLMELKKKQCSHENVELSGGGTWNSWTDWGYNPYNPYNVKCLDCGLFGSDNDKRQKYI